MAPKTLLPALLGGLVLSAQVQALELKDCRIYDNTGVASVAAQCGRLQVPENPDAPDGKQIKLFVARIPTLSQQRTEDAFTVLAGGPGEAATQDYVSLADSFQRIRRSHDILLVDQRGTGKSNRMSCDFPADEITDDWQEEQTLQALKTCRDNLPGDPRFYTTSVAVRDLDAVRAALGYTHLVVYGVSYGTRVAQHYLRRYPENTRSVILDGVVPPGVALGPGIALKAQRALDMVFSRCELDSACNEAFPRLGEAFARVRHLLEQKPVELDIADPKTSKPVHIRLTYERMAMTVRLLSYSPLTASLLPLVISQADRGDYAPLAAQGMIAIASVQDMLAYGMHNAVMCTEDIPFVNDSTLDMAAINHSYLGARQLKALEQICQIWPRGFMDPDFRDPLVSDKPVLLLSGEADPITPPAYADKAASTLSNSRQLVGPGQGHGMIAVGCVARLVADFVRDGSLAQLDDECVKRLGPAPFFLDANGPTS